MPDHVLGIRCFPFYLLFIEVSIQLSPCVQLYSLYCTLCTVCTYIQYKCSSVYKQTCFHRHSSHMTLFWLPQLAFITPDRHRTDTEQSPNRHRTGKKAKAGGLCVQHSLKIAILDLKIVCIF